MNGAEFSKSTVQDLCKRLDPIVLKIRADGRMRSRAAMIATGINEDGYREILGMMLGGSESEANWTESFSAPIFQTLPPLIYPITKVVIKRTDAAILDRG